MSTLDLTCSFIFLVFIFLLLVLPLLELLSTLNKHLMLRLVDLEAQVEVGVRPGEQAQLSQAVNRRSGDDHGALQVGIDLFKALHESILQLIMLVKRVLELLEHTDKFLLLQESHVLGDHNNPVRDDFLGLLLLS